VAVNTLYLFYLLSFLGIFFALLVVFSKNPVYSVLYLILTFFTIAGHYVLLNAEFLAAVHVIVYAGAIMVLFLYVIMMLNLNKVNAFTNTNLVKAAATITAGLLLVILVGGLKGTEILADSKAAIADIGLVKSLGRILFKEFLLPFEVASVLLLAAMVGAVMLVKNKDAK
jgi:NADH-quinone oxidoreductase subunit J